MKVLARFKLINFLDICCIFLLLPQVFFSLFLFVAFPAADDISRLGSMVIHAPTNFFEVIVEAFRYSFRYYGFNGTYAHFFLQFLNPANISITLYRVNLFVLFWFFILAIFVFIKTISKYILFLEPKVAAVVGLGIGFLAVNSSLAPWETFFWLPGALNYIFVLSCILVALSIITRMYFGGGKSWLCHLLLVVLLVLVNGSQQGGGLLLNAILFFACVCHFIDDYKKRNRSNLFLYFYFALSVLLFLLNFVGSAGRMGETGSLLSIVRVLVMSSYYTVINVYWWHGTSTILLLLLTLPAIADAIKKNKLQFAHPLLASIVAFGLVAATFAPSVFNGFLPGRVMDFSFHTSLIVVFLWFFYLAGYFVKKFRGSLCQCEGKSAARNQIYIIAVIILLVVTGAPNRLIYGNYSRGVREIQYGQMQQFVRIMNSRLEIYNNPRAMNIEIANLPFDTMFFGFDLPANDWSWHNEAYERFYNKDSIIGREYINGRVFRVVSPPIFDVPPVGEYIVRQYVDTIRPGHGYLVDIIGRLPQNMSHEQMRLMMFSGDAGVAYYVFPFVANASSSDTTGYFTVAIDYSLLDDGKYSVFLEAQGMYIFQGYLELPCGSFSVLQYP